jgi:hypothetical protein
VPSRFSLLLSPFWRPVVAADAQAIDWAKIDATFGRSPAAVAGEIHRYGFPRTDLQVTLDGVTIRPTLALGGWIAFEPMGGSMAMAMGDLVLLQTEVNPVMAKLLEGGLEVTAVHNHLLRSEPLTFYMHVGGHGDPMKMAQTIHDALAVSKTPLTPQQRAARRLPSISIRDRSIKSLAGRAPTTAEYTRSTYRAAIRLPSKACQWAHPSWAARPRSASNRPAAAKQQSLAILR